MKRKRSVTRHEKYLRDTNKHPIRESCDCRMKCRQNIDESRRGDIWNAYWSMDYDQRKKWLFESIEKMEKKRCIAGDHESRRDKTFKYKMKDANGLSQTVCKSFFLSTLGYKKNNDQAVMTAFQHRGSVIPSEDRRGRHNKKTKFDR